MANYRYTFYFKEKISKVFCCYRVILDQWNFKLFMKSEVEMVL